MRDAFRHHFYPGWNSRRHPAAPVCDAGGGHPRRRAVRRHSQPRVGDGRLGGAAEARRESRRTSAGRGAKGASAQQSRARSPPPTVVQQQEAAKSRVPIRGTPIVDFVWTPLGFPGYWFLRSMFGWIWFCLLRAVDSSSQIAFIRFWILRIHIFWKWSTDSMRA